MINGDLPPRIKRDAHTIILDFIRSRPPLRKVSFAILKIWNKNAFYKYFSVRNCHLFFEAVN